MAKLMKSEPISANDSIALEVAEPGGGGNRPAAAVFRERKATHSGAGRPVCGAGRCRGVVAARRHLFLATGHVAQAARFVGRRGLGQPQARPQGRPGARRVAQDSQAEARERAHAARPPADRGDTDTVPPSLPCRPPEASTDSHSRRPPPTVSANNELRRPTQNGRMSSSAAIGRVGLRRNQARPEF